METLPTPIDVCATGNVDELLKVQFNTVVGTMFQVKLGSGVSQSDTGALHYRRKLCMYQERARDKDGCWDEVRVVRHLHPCGCGHLGTERGLSVCQGETWC